MYIIRSACTLAAVLLPAPMMYWVIIHFVIRPALLLSRYLDLAFGETDFNETWYSTCIWRDIGHELINFCECKSRSKVSRYDASVD